ncbi:flavin reductase family protein [Aquabacterium sp.]|uniref:flavin reductase family protein n=1 Tax=Aquabacterium sp. TaxID=1872578 RepID=UPI0035B1C434
MSQPQSDTASQTTFTPEEYRAALGQFATGVTVVTARAADGSLVGLTANSFNSVSLDPPLVLWSLAKQSGSMPGFLSASHYAINVLGADQRQLAERFARKGIDRFDGAPWKPGLTGAPVIDGAVAVFECEQRSQHDEGDHVIFVGRVMHCRRRVGVPPLVYQGGRFFTDLNWSAPPHSGPAA